MLQAFFAQDPGVHAVLFYGLEGSPKGRAASLLANHWLCTAPTPNGPCGECKACGAFSRSANADLLTLSPHGASEVIKVWMMTPSDAPEAKDTLPLTTFARTMPLMSRFKVALIEDAHRMNADASNALLKTLEEPPASLRLILTTSGVGQLRPTILSRCLAVACEMPLDDEPPAPGLSRLEAETEPWRVELHRRVGLIAEGLSTRPRREALLVAEELRSVADWVKATTEWPSRKALGETLRSLARVRSAQGTLTPQAAREIAECHRRIVGNANASITTEALMATLMERGGT